MVKYLRRCAVINVKLRCLLRDRRRARGYSQRQFEIIAGIPRSQLSAYENDKIVMSLETAAKIALLLNCALDDLYDYR